MNIRKVLSSSLCPGLALALALAPAPVSAQTPASVFNALNTTPELYAVAPFDPNCVQTYRVFLPETAFHDQPESGWPVLIHLSLASYVFTEDIDTIDPADGNLPVCRLLSRALQSGIAVVTARATPSIELSTDDGKEDWAELCANSPLTPPTQPSDLPGHGMFHPPGLQSDDVDLACYDSLAYAMPEKDAVMIVQHVRYHAGLTEVANPDTATEWLRELDPDRIAVHGESAGAISLMWGALGPDRSQAEPFAGETGQYAIDSRPDAAVLALGCVWWPIFDKDSLVYIPRPHFGEATGLGFSGHSEDAAHLVGQSEMQDLIDGSAFAYALAEPIVPVYMSYDFVSECTDYEPISPADPPCDASYTWPVCFACQDDEGATPHPAWSGYAWETAHPDDTRLAVVDAAALAQQEDVEDAQMGAGHVVGMIGENAGAYANDRLDALNADIVYWLLDVFGSADEPDPAQELWVTIQTGPTHNVTSPSGLTMPVSVAGTGGTPVLVGTGEQVSGGPITLELSGAKPNATFYLFTNQEADYVPFKQGLMVPRVGGLFYVLSTDSNGEWELGSGSGGTWLTGIPAGARVFMQAWVVDSGAPVGFAGSNALMAIAQ
jgi:hypothetical protein